MRLAHIRRGGAYYRVCKPDWVDCSDTSYAKRFGGRWNPSGEFGALYLCATVEVAAAVARSQHAGRAITLFSLRPERRPQLQSFFVSQQAFVDIVTDRGVAAAGLPKRYPFGVDRSSCWGVARHANAQEERGIACRSAAESAPGFWLGEELAIFDNGPMPRQKGRRREFAAWYPDLIPKPD